MRRFFLTFFYLVCLSCNRIEAPKVENNSGIYKPKGLYSSSFGNETALDNAHVNGALIRVKWNDIEPEEGIYDFSLIDQFLLSIKERNLEWSLGIIAGESSPLWLFEDEKVDSFEITDFYGNVKVIPKMWDNQVIVKLNQLALALAAKYGNDEDLGLCPANDC